MRRFQIALTTLFFIGLGSSGAASQKDCSALISSWKETHRALVVECLKGEENSGRITFFSIEKALGQNSMLSLNYYVASRDGLFPETPVSQVAQIGIKLLPINFDGKVQSLFLSDINGDGKKDLIYRAATELESTLQIIKIDSQVKGGFSFIGFLPLPNGEEQTPRDLLVSSRDSVPVFTKDEISYLWRENVMGQARKYSGVYRLNRKSGVYELIKVQEQSKKR
jgi:hypothetical protein